MLPNSELQSGDRIGMYFTHGSIQHPVFGNAKNLSGVIPLLLTYGKYPTPAIVSDKPRLEKIIDSLTAECRELWENDMDDVIKAKIKEYLFIGAFTNPLDDVETPGMQCLVSALIVIFALDDVLDLLDDISEEGFKYEEINKIRKFFLDLYDGVYKKIDDIPNPFPSVESATRYIWKCDRKLEANIPNFHERDSELRKEWDTSIRSFVLLMEKNPSGDEFSEQSLKLFGAINSGMLLTLELIAIMRNIVISQQIRRDVLFQSVRMALASVSTLMNAIFGFARDIKLNQVNDSSILRQVRDKGVALQDAFDEALTLLCVEINDIRVGIIKLKERYAKDHPSIIEYLRVIENMVDGQIYCYAQTTRYGKLDMKVTKLAK